MTRALALILALAVPAASFACERHRAAKSEASLKRKVKAVKAKAKTAAVTQLDAKESRAAAK